MTNLHILKQYNLKYPGYEAFVLLVTSLGDQCCEVGIECSFRGVELLLTHLCVGYNCQS